MADAKRPSEKILGFVQSFLILQIEQATAELEPYEEMLIDWFDRSYEEAETHEKRFQHERLTQSQITVRETLSSDETRIDTHLLLAFHRKARYKFLLMKFMEKDYKPVIDTLKTMQNPRGNAILTVGDETVELLDCLIALRDTGNQ